MKRYFLVLNLVLIFFGVNAQTFFSSAPKLKEQFIRLSTGVRLEYVEQGNPDGIPVVFLHGITDSWRSFESTLKHLPSTIHAFALSQRGHGDSERPVEGYKPTDFAADVAAFIMQKNLGAAIIVGHSMGGVNAQQFAIKYPTLTKALVIVDSDVSFKNNPGMPEFYQEVMNMKGNFTREFMESFQKGSLARPIDSIYFRRLVNESMKVPLTVFQAAFKGLIQVDFTNDLQKLDVPAAIFWGEKDAFCFRSGQEAMAKALKNSKLIIYQGIGHALQWEEPERFVNDLIHFIQEVEEKPTVRIQAARPQVALFTKF